MSDLELFFRIELFQRREVSRAAAFHRLEEPIPMPRHDSLWKGLLRSFFRDFLCLTAPEVVPRAIEFLDKELLPLDPGRNRRELDLLVRVLCDLGTTLLVHAEVEARYRRSMPARLWRYFLLLQSRFEEPVRSLLVNLRGGPPGISHQTLEDRTSGQLRTFEYTVVGLAGSSPVELLARPEPLAWAFAALSRSEELTRPALKLACLERVAEAKLSERENYLLVNCIESYLDLTPEETAELEALRPHQPESKGIVMEMTWADRMRDEGRKLGRKEGFQEGQEFGVRQLLLYQLRRRFGKLSAEVERRVEAIRSPSRLNRLAEQVLVARSLAEMGLE